MSKRSFGLGLLAILVVGLGGGCKKSAPATLLLPPPPVETVVGIHWVGKQRLTADTNAAALMGIWSLPESRKLEAQTLDRLAVGLLARGRGEGASNQLSVISNRLPVIGNQPSVNTNQLSISGSRSAATNHTSLTNSQPAQLTGSPALLRPLLEDLLEQESFINVRQAAEQPRELTLAIRLSAERARLWQTNLAALLESLTAGRAAPVPGRSNGWQLQFRDSGPPGASQQPLVTRTCDLALVGEWTVVGLARGSNGSFGQTLTLFREHPTGEGLTPSNLWLFANVNLRRVAGALSVSSNLAAELPRLALGVTGDGKMVHTRGQLNFAEPLPFSLEPWNIPTNLIHDPLSSFTAIQGLRPWLASSKLWQGLDLGTPPNQFYLWAQASLNCLSYVAAPMANASNCVERATDLLLQKPGAYVASNGIGNIERSTNGAGVSWSGVLFTAPYLQPIALSGGDFVFGGLLPNPATNRPAPAELFRVVLGTTNLVAYDCELTGERLDEWLDFGQLFRFALHLAQIPPPSASFAWLRALEPKLGSSVTAVRRTGLAQLSFTRNSTLGLTAAELDWLADWLESPQFPHGLNTFLGEPASLGRRPPPGYRPRASTNSAPALPPNAPRPATSLPSAKNRR